MTWRAYLGRPYHSPGYAGGAAAAPSAGARSSSGPSHAPVPKLMFPSSWLRAARLASVVARALPAMECVSPVPYGQPNIDDIARHLINTRFFTLDVERLRVQELGLGVHRGLLVDACWVAAAHGGVGRGQ